MRSPRLTALAAALAALFAASCGPGAVSSGSVEPDPVRAELEPVESVLGSPELLTAGEVQDGWRLTPMLQTPDGASRVSLLLELAGEADPASLLEVRGAHDDGSMGPWVSATVTSSEGRYLTAFADLGFDATSVQARLAEALAQDVRALHWSAGKLNAPGAGDEAGTSRQGLSGELAGLGVVPRSAWTSAGAWCSGDGAKYRISVHNTASAAFTDAASLRAVRQYHVNKGYCDIAYHFVITIDGTIFEGRALSSLGAHTLNQNSGSVGISLAGCFQPGECDSIASPQTPSGAMLSSLTRLIAALGRTEGIALDRGHVKGHREWNAGTSCPGAGVLSRLDAVVGAAAGAPANLPAAGPVVGGPGHYVGLAGSANGEGYWVVKDDGGVFSYQTAFFGSMGAVRLNQPVIALERLRAGNGYWLLARDGGLFSFGAATFHGSLGGTRLNAPVVGMASTPSGKGYWMVAADGGVFAFGDAAFKGSLGATHLNQPIIGVTATPSGKGYWLLAADGGIFAFGDAPFRGSLGATHLNQPIVAMAATPTGQGYWMVAADGGVFAFGDAPFKGSLGATHLNQPIVGMAATPTGKGYWLVAGDGGVFTFGDAPFRGRP